MEPELDQNFGDDRILSCSESNDFFELVLGQELCWCWSLSHVQLFATPWIITSQTPLSMGFSRKEY